MAKNGPPENMSYAELVELSAKVERLMVSKKNEARAELRDKIAGLAKAQGMSLDDIFSGKKGNGRGKGMVTIKYRDPNDPANTWTGRGRTPRWMVAAMKGGKAKKEDFLI
jgi:DNA-binding protein H-NS